MTTQQMDKLVDNFGRTVNYLRISVTDRCDFRCVYCMDDEMSFVPRSNLLRLEELGQIAKAFTQLGVSKIRITGGEPLVRRNVLKLFNDIGRLTGLQELTLTTNGSQLAKYAAELKSAGVKRINVSLDSLKAEQFKRITRVGNLQTVLEGIDAAVNTGFEKIKINSVILKNRNDDEIIPLVQYASERGLDISFIEEMPLGVIGDHDRNDVFYSSDQIKQDIEQAFDLLPTTETTGGPSRYFRLAGTNSKVGFISPHSHNFCESCNRVRLTCEGRLLLCLGQEHSVDLRAVVREYPNDMDRLKQSIRDAMTIKPEGHEFNIKEQPVIFRHMNVTGG